MMFKLPTLQSLLNEAIQTLKRFPLALLAAILATFLGMYLIHSKVDDHHHLSNLWKIVMSCSLGLNLFLTAALFSESRKDTFFQCLLKQLFALALIVCYYFLSPDFKEFRVQEVARFALFSIGLHLLVSFSPFMSTGHINGFWQFNKTLFLRFITAFLYTVILFNGLALALIAVDKLFQVEISWEYYYDLWLFLAGIFNTWFFLAGVPKQTQALEDITDYPKGLKIFTQFVLLPLVTVYLFILYAYSIKIAAAMELPHGWVSYLVIGFSVAGILSLLLIWPIREHEENSWIKIFSRWFYRALYPLIILLGLAIFKRISQYGITENRYFVLIIALWLVGIATYFLFSKAKNIKVVPMSLCFIAFFSSFGPWGAFSVSERSQIARLFTLLSEQKIIVDGKIKKATPLLKGHRAEKICSIVGYLDKVHGFKDIQPWFTENLDSIFIKKDSTGSGYINEEAIVLDLMGVQYYRPYSVNGERYFQISSENVQPTITINVKGYDYYSEFNDLNSYNNDSSQSYLILDKDTLVIKLNNNRLQLLNNKKTYNGIDFVDFVRTLQKNNEDAGDYYLVPKSQLLLPIEMDSLSVQFNFTAISGLIYENDSIKIDNIQSKVLIKRK